MRVTDKFVFFFTKDDIFSNHYRCARQFWLPKHQAVGAKFWTVEHFMMYEKAMLFGDTSIAVDIANTYSPQQAKLLGRKIKNFNEEKWQAFRETIVINGLYAKMQANTTIKDAALKLYLEGKTFVEASPYDAIWGIKMGENDPGVEDLSNWKGHNLLGKCWEKAIERVIANKEVH